MQSWRGRASSGVIRVARRFVANTPIQRLPLTTAIYRRVFKLGYPSDEVSISFRGVDLTLPTGDVTIVPGLIGGYYEKIELDVFERLCRTSRTVVDVGANIGLFSCLAASRMPAGGTVVSFEPIPANLRYLRQNLEQNGFLDEVTVEASAVGEKAGAIDIFLVEGSIGTHSASARNAASSENMISVPMVSLDSYATGHLVGPIDVLKVDVEGYEGHVLRGASTVLTEQRPSMLVEYVPDHLINCGFPPEKFLDIVFDLYELVYLVDEVRGIIHRRTKSELLDPALKHKNCNLIAVDGDVHAEHAEAIESLSAALSRH